jgi:hypothetical protein
MISGSENLFLQSLVPIGIDTFEKESFESYKRRVCSVASNIPECVLENWIYRHYSSVASCYSFLNFNEMQFTKEEWPKDDIFSLIKSYDDGMINYLGYQLYKRENKSWLQDYMLKHMT